VAERLANWYRLEGGALSSVDLVVASTRDKVAAVAKAQEEGLVTTRYSPVELLALVVHLAALWSSTAPELGTLAADIPVARRRQVVVDAVAALVRD
jgi:hypothetical protein